MLCGALEAIFSLEIFFGKWLPKNHRHATTITTSGALYLQPDVEKTLKKSRDSGSPLPGHLLRTTIQSTTPSRMCFQGGTPNNSPYNPRRVTSSLSTQKNPLGKLKAGFARVESSLTCIISHVQYGQNSSEDPLNCPILLKNSQKLDAQVSFDNSTEYPWPITQQSKGGERNACDALMVTSYIGLVVRPTNAARAEFMRIGMVTVSDDEFGIVSGKFLTASDYSERQSVTFV